MTTTTKAKPEPSLPEQAAAALEAAQARRTEVLDRIAAGSNVEPVELAEADAAIRLAEMRIELGERNATAAAENARLAELARLVDALTAAGHRRRLEPVVTAYRTAAAALVALHAAAKERQDAVGADLAEARRLAFDGRRRQLRRHPSSRPRAAPHRRRHRPRHRHRRSPMTARPEDVPAELRRDLDSIRANNTLTAQAKKTRIAQAYIAAKAEQQQRLATIATEKAIRKRTLERRLFGTQTPVGATDEARAAIEASYRQALDRASQTTTEAERAALLQRAELVGDEPLARAVAAVAFAAAEDTVVNLWLDTRPSLDGAANELWDATHGATSATSEAGWHLANALDPPAELDGAGDFTIAQIAQQDERRAATA